MRNHPIVARPRPAGAILAGGRGRRIGGTKATVNLHGRPLISYPLEAMRAALQEVAVIAKPDTELPSLPGVKVWIEPDGPRHPLMGIIHSLELGAGRAMLVCALDLPLVSPGLIARIARADPGAAPAVVAHGGGSMQPLLGCYQPPAADLLRAAAGPRFDVPARTAVAAIEPLLLEVPDPDELFNVNTPDDLLQAAAMLDAGLPKRKVVRTDPGRKLHG